MLEFAVTEWIDISNLEEVIQSIKNVSITVESRLYDCASIGQLTKSLPMKN